MKKLLLSFALIILSLDSLACLKMDACESDMNYAIGEFNKQNYKDAIPPLERCSTSQVKEIQNFCSNVLGSFYLEGLGVKQNYEKSLTYFNYTAGMDSDYKNQVIEWIKKAENGIKKEKELQQIASAKKAEEKKKAEERKRIADAKKAEEKKKAEERKRIADAKKAEEKKRIADAKREEQKRIADVKLKNALSLLPPKTKLQEAQEFLSDIQDYIKSNPDEFDFFEIVKFTKNTKLISEGISDDEQLKNVDLFKVFIESSDAFLKFQKNRRDYRLTNELAKIDKLIDNVNSSFLELKQFLFSPVSNKENLSSTTINLLDEKIKSTQLIINNPKSFAELDNTKKDLESFLSDLRAEVRKTFSTKNENRKIQNEFNVELKKIDENINNLKTYYVENIDTISDDLTDLILEQVTLIQNVKESISLDNKKEGLEELLKVNEETSSFKLDNNLLTSDEVAAIKKAETDKKKADAKKIADKKKEEEQKRKAEEKRKADAKEAKRLKNFKTVSMRCIYQNTNGVQTINWLYDGKNIYFEGVKLQNGMKDITNVNIRKLSGKDRFSIDFTMAYIPMNFINDFNTETSELELIGLRIYGNCY